MKNYLYCIKKALENEPESADFFNTQGKIAKALFFFLFHADGGALPTQNLFPMLEIRSQHFPEYAVSKVSPILFLTPSTICGAAIRYYRHIFTFLFFFGTGL